jgi:hypothetical protein
LKGYGNAFTYGYLGEPNAAGLRPYVTEGDTTGTIAPGPSGEIAIDIPKGGKTLSGLSNDDWGAPEVGSILDNPVAHAYILGGTPEPLPPNPTNIRRGLLEKADDTQDALVVCSAYVNP